MTSLQRGLFQTNACGPCAWQSFLNVPEAHDSYSSTLGRPVEWWGTGDRQKEIIEVDVKGNIHTETMRGNLHEA